MNKDLFRPFGDNFSATASDFQASDSYRLVRYGAISLLIGYLSIAPSSVYFTYKRIAAPGADVTSPEVLLLLIMVSAVLFIFVGCVLLAFSPKPNEKLAARKFLIAYGIALGCLVAARTMNITQLSMVQRVAQAYGMFYLIAYFQVLGINRDNSSLIDAAHMTNRAFIVVILLGLGLVIGGDLVGLPPAISIGILSLCLVYLYFAWVKTLWHAYKSTLPIERDFAMENEESTGR